MIPAAPTRRPRGRGINLPEIANLPNLPKDRNANKYSNLFNRRNRTSGNRGRSRGRNRGRNRNSRLPKIPKLRRGNGTRTGVRRPAPRRPTGRQNHPCLQVDCGEAGCFLHPSDNQPRCVCTNTDVPVPPDEHGKCPDPSLPRRKPSRQYIIACKDKDCGQARCVYDRILLRAKCVCHDFDGPPGKDGKCPPRGGHSIDLNPPRRRGKENHPCLQADCGEAGCFLHPDDNQPRCVCTNTDVPVPPDEHGKCPDPSQPGSGPTRLPKNEADACTQVFCGEYAGCILEEGVTRCVCPGSFPFVSPDDQGRCPNYEGGPVPEPFTRIPDEDNPCAKMACGDGGCFVLETGEAACGCMGMGQSQPEPPDEDGNCPSSLSKGQNNPCSNLLCRVGSCVLKRDNEPICDCDMDTDQTNQNITQVCDTVPIPHPCTQEDAICGEAACVADPKTFKAVCTCLHESGVDEPPNEKGHCRPTGQPRNIQNDTLNSERKFWDVIHANDQNKTQNNFKSNGTVMHQKELTVDNIQLAYIVPPLLVVGIAILTILLCFFWRRRHEGRIRAAHAQSPISWLHRQESFQLLDQMAVISKNPGYYTPNLDPVLLQSLKDRTIAREKLSLLDEIGEGAFGKVYKGEICWEESRTEKVAVKVLKEGASRETQDDFKREVEIMSTFDHCNILRLIGVVANEKSSPFMVFEYMEHGDLAELLRNNDPNIHKGIKLMEMKQSDLVDIATQIANGMVYLTSQHFVHRDLAARNCLVGAELHVKISDFGMSRDIYTCDYYRIGGSRMLPVRWMSPESVKYGRFTTESDVWAYGVVLWEIFSYGKQPYYGHTNEEVIRFIEDSILLQRPEECPSTIYHIMLGCWRSNPKDRFTFDKIHHHLVELDRQVVKCYNQLDMCDNQIEV